MGITTVRQIAGLEAARIAEIDAALALHGRIERDEWVAQAGALLAGGGA